jgi:DNA-binding LytR/AlgR family response regulator
LFGHDPAGGTRRQRKAVEGQGAVTNGEAAGTNGGKAGTSGWRLDWAPFAAVAGVALLIAALNATSEIMKAAADGVTLDAREPWAFELSSIVMVTALTPFIAWCIWRFAPPERVEMRPWARFLAIHLGAATVFSAGHIAGMTALREAAFAAAGADYSFADGGSLAMPLLYEWRKDVLTYAAIALTFWAWRRLGAPAQLATPPEATADRRIEVRDGARVVLIEPADIAWLEAAGNYVEIHAGGARRLARGTLASFEAKLAGEGFVRVHRSRLVNRRRVAGFQPTPSGDLAITLDDGRVIAGSRRFRGALDAR